ncbi:MAG: F0F1 ATP synthase subunit A [Symbiobacteriaceae bacterium]|nr:F0F1 ATP synthase subunit A [Symbiobacteriaceae bacterium]
MDFNIDNLWVLQVGGQEVWITRTILNTWIIMAFLIVAAIVINVLLRNPSSTPKGLQNAMEMIVEVFDGMLKTAIDPGIMYVGNWYFSVFAFILVSNFSGVLGFRPPTADWATTFALAMATLILIQVVGIRHRKGEYIKEFFSPNFVFFPLNLIGELARPISLSFRLFGNILGGMILMTLVYSLAPIFVRIFFPVFLHAIFDIFFGALQTYIFCVISLTFVGAAAGVVSGNAE